MAARVHRAQAPGPDPQRTDRRPHPRPRRGSRGRASWVHQRHGLCVWGDSVGPTAQTRPPGPDPNPEPTAALAGDRPGEAGRRGLPGFTRDSAGGELPPSDSSGSPSAPGPVPERMDGRPPPGTPPPEKGGSHGPSPPSPRPLGPSGLLRLRQPRRSPPAAPRRRPCSVLPLPPARPPPSPPTLGPRPPPLPGLCPLSPTSSPVPRSAPRPAPFPAQPAAGPHPGRRRPRPTRLPPQSPFGPRPPPRGGTHRRCGAA